MRSIILDTDIGSDVDDAMALAQLMGSPELELVEVHTVYGDTRLRAQLARRYAALAGRDVDVVPGVVEPISGREVWWAGHEGTLHADLDAETISADSAPERLVARLRARPGELDVAAIGPLTNLAAAFALEPQAAGWIRHLWVMGGGFGAAEDAEHNFRSDDVAAQAVLNAGVPTTITGLEITRQVTIEAARLERIRAAGPLGAALGADIEQWWAFWNETWNVPHDPVALLALSRPELFTFSETGRVTIAIGGEAAGHSTFTPDPTGSVRIVTGVDGEQVAEEITSRIVTAGTAYPARHEGIDDNRA
ncbi:nucleoside hydrolase [Kribbella solani]|uniref:nucleoside hydrolase n=1 Tax=Kribbella solani TaxID=236067 RepID=UPI0029BC1135|nr:nucleoside hydrolase [Kribbella solani]MDX2970657.1 nucleoside hydrolase [Kribbella solani]MDX3002337.1 nucleoside hydrolase [Kribbella solani]